MKKFSCIVLAIAVCLAFMMPAFSATKPKGDFQFGSDGKFKIMQMNDTQDVVLKDVKQAKYVVKAIVKENPDLIVMVGDQLTDFFPGATEAGLETCLRNWLDVLNETGIPFVFTYGNHDHDWEDFFTLQEQMDIYKSYSNCVVPDTGCDLGTYNIPIKSSDGSKTAFNLYLMDTNNKAPDGLITGYEGLRPYQVEWYRQTSDKLKAENGGKVVPSLLFQHVPVKEIYQFLDEVPCTGDVSEAVFSIDNNTWYKLNDKVISGFIGEPPCSESLDGHTGEYEAWVEKGDLVGAFFAHDHVNSFVGITDEGIKMGYNAGTGFSTYGPAGNRAVRIFEIDEDAPADYDTYEITYNEIMNQNVQFFITDLFSPAIFTTIGRFFLNLIPDPLLDLIARIADGC